MSNDCVALDSRSLKHLALAINLYLSSPESHPYLMYDLTYDLSRSKVYLKVRSGEVQAYLIIWRGPAITASILWGECSDLINYVPRNYGMIVQTPKHVVNELINYLRGSGSVKAVEYLDMMVSEETFKPYRKVKAVRLNPKSPEHVREFIKLRSESGVNVSEDMASEIISRQRPYGVFTDNELASLALTYVRLPEVWVVGGVYTKPEYRGRGYAKAVTSAVTEDALRSGAKAVLHVRKDNEAALRVYRRLGYEVINEKVWVFYKPSTNR